MAAVRMFCTYQSAKSDTIYIGGFVGSPPCSLVFLPRRICFGFADINYTKPIYGLTLTSAALASGFLRILGNLATVEAFYEMLAKMLVCVVLEGILCSLLSCYIVKKMMQ